MAKEPLTILKDCRENQLGLTQDEFGGEVGVTGVTVSRWETGARKIARSKLPAVVEKTGIAARDLRPDLSRLLGAESGQ